MKVWLAVFGLALVACTTDFPCAEIGGELDPTGECVFVDADAGADASVPSADAAPTSDATTPDASDASDDADAPRDAATDG